MDKSNDNDTFSYDYDLTLVPCNKSTTMHSLINIQYFMNKTWIPSGKKHKLNFKFDEHEECYNIFRYSVNKNKETSSQQIKMKYIDKLVGTITLNLSFVSYNTKYEQDNVLSLWYKEWMVCYQICS